MNVILREEKIEELLISFCSQIACGMDYLHANDYIHGNLASHNVQLSKSRNCKVSHFHYFEAHNQ